MGWKNLGVAQSDIRRRVGEMASYFGIQDWYHRNTDALSGGQKRLLNLAAVMVMQPRLLLLDEPTGQLDPIAAADFIATLQKLNRELGLTIVLAEHRLEEVFPIADQVIAMDRGRILTAAPAPPCGGGSEGASPEPGLAQRLPDLERPGSAGAMSADGQGGPVVFGGRLQPPQGGFGTADGAGSGRAGFGGGAYLVPV